MNTSEIVSKLWSQCNVLRDDGITYHQYVTELTYILFLKMMEETGQEEKIEEGCRWKDLTSKSGIELKKFYNKLLEQLSSSENSKVKLIYTDARTNIDEPANLKKIITNIDKLDWYNAKEEGLGDLYEGLLEKNANETKSGAGQYFTPRVLIDVMTALINPNVGEKCNDPACGTFGFMIAANRHIMEMTDDLMNYSIVDQEKQEKEMFTGVELVKDTHRLAMMNALLHDIESEIKLGDTLSSVGESVKGFDVVLTNPPFGTKKGGERATRSDLLFPTSNKQLNFLQHIYRSLAKKTSKNNPRCAVVLPDNVLFAEGDGTNIRKDLMEKCNLHTVLRLPTGIFYAQGVKTNVLFFEQGEKREYSTKEVYFYDMRTNMVKFNKTNPLKKSDFEGFIKAYTSDNRDLVDDERWSKYSIEDILAKDSVTLDLGLIQDNRITNYDDLTDPIDSGEEMIAKLEEAADLIASVVNELKLLGDNNG